MAAHRPDLPNQLKKRLRAAAGEKCANPGCSALRTHLHHIREWAVYASHDESQMIAVCPACHDAVHNRALAISDDTLIRWRNLRRPASGIRTHLYVEPSVPPKVLLGSVAVSSTQPGAVIFDLSPTARLAFRTIDHDLLLLSLCVATLSGEALITVTDNHVTHQPQAGVRFLVVPGHIRLDVPLSADFVQAWAVTQMQRQDPTYGLDGMLPAIDIEVLKPGLVRVQGSWPRPDRVVVATDDRLAFLRRGADGPLSIMGAGEDSVLLYAGPITDAIFRA